MSDAAEQKIPFHIVRAVEIFREFAASGAAEGLLLDGFVLQGRPGPELVLEASEEIGGVKYQAQHREFIVLCGAESHEIARYALEDILRSLARERYRQITGGK